MKDWVIEAIAFILIIISFVVTILLTVFAVVAPFYLIYLIIEKTL